jgi:hypothetical protein
VPGHVALLHADGLLVGRLDGANDELVERVRAVFDKALPTVVSANIRGARWAKLIASLGEVAPYPDPYVRSRGPRARGHRGGRARRGAP